MEKKEFILQNITKFLSEKAEKDIVNFIYDLTQDKPSTKQELYNYTNILDSIYQEAEARSK